MPFISSSEAKNAYFMSGKATNEIFIFSLHEMKARVNCYTDLDFNHCPLYSMEAFPSLVASPVFLYRSGCSGFPQELSIPVKIGHVKKFY